MSQQYHFATYLSRARTSTTSITNCDICNLIKLNISYIDILTGRVYTKKDTLLDLSLV